MSLYQISSNDGKFLHERVHLMPVAGCSGGVGGREWLGDGTFREGRAALAASGGFSHGPAGLVASRLLEFELFGQAAGDPGQPGWQFPRRAVAPRAPH